MHEYSIISSLIDLCEEHAKEHNTTEIITITIEVGERSGVDTQLLQSAFEVFREESMYCQNSTLEIREKKIELLCHHCHAQFNPQGLEYAICPYCQSNNLDIIAGKELHLLSLEMQ